MSNVVEIDSGVPHVALVEIRRGPFNYINMQLLRNLADILDSIDQQAQYRCTVLTTEGKAFCAGAELSSASEKEQMAKNTALFYEQALRIYGCKKPLIAAVHGAAVGAGLGLAVAADFRVTCAQARFVANFTRLGFHPGFGLSHTLPRLIGHQRASEMFFTGRRLGGEEAVRIGLADTLVHSDQVRTAALGLAREIAGSAPLAVMATRASLRGKLVDAVAQAMNVEVGHQTVHMATEDVAEGIKAMAERRDPVFRNR